LHENNPLQLPVKVIINAIYGKTAQRVGRNIGNLFNPVIASTITGMGRAMLYDFIRKNNIENQTVSFATDSVITQKRLEINSNHLGAFKFEKSGNDVYVLQNGIYRFNGKWKQRGLGKLGAREIEHLDTEERDGQLYMKFKVLRVARLRSSIIANEIDKIGQFNTIERKVRLNADTKRLWFEKLANINDKTMMVSFPIPLPEVLV
jgi:hypothetical protein